MKWGFIRRLPVCITVIISAHVYGACDVGMCTSWVNFLRNSPVLSTMNRWKVPALVGLGVAGLWAFKNRQLIREDYLNFRDCYWNTESTFLTHDVTTGPCAKFNFIPFLKFFPRINKYDDSNSSEEEEDTVEDLVGKTINHAFFGLGTIMRCVGRARIGRKMYEFQFGATTRTLSDRYFELHQGNVRIQDCAYCCSLASENRGECLIPGALKGECWPCYGAHHDRIPPGWKRFVYSEQGGQCHFKEEDGHIGKVAISSKPGQKNVYKTVQFRRMDPTS